jgi:lipopolysaccharide export system permease protein
MAFVKLLSTLRLTRLDRYILGKFLRTFGFVMLLFLILSMVVDFSEKVEDFIKRKPGWYEIVVNYYLNFIPYIVSVMLPLYVLIAVIFFTSRMAYNSEVISILNAGVSFKRFLRPYLVGAAGIALLSLLGSHWFIPMANKKRLAFEHKFVWLNNDKGKSSDVHMYLDPNTKIFVQSYSKRDSSVYGFRLERFKNKQLVSLIKADTCMWLGPPDHWQIAGFTEHFFIDSTERIINGLNQRRTMRLNFEPNDFVRYLEQKEMLTTAEMQHFISRERARGMGNVKQYQVESARRSTEPVSLLILTIIGAAVAARKVRGGLGVHLITGIGLGALFIFLTKMSVALSTNLHIPPHIGVWIPNTIFAIIAVRLYRNAQS